MQTSSWKCKFHKWGHNTIYQVGSHSQSETHSEERKKAFNLKSVSSIYNAWAASLTPGVTLNSSKLITIDWGFWQRQQDDVYLHVYFASLSLILCLVTSLVSCHKLFPFSSYIRYLPLSSSSITVSMFSPSPLFILRRHINEKRCWGWWRILNTAVLPLKTSFTSALICINWKGMNLGIWVCRLICTKYNECVLVCAPFSLCLRRPPPKDRGDERTQPLE